jgi:hypothetical protein
LARSPPAAGCKGGLTEDERNGLQVVFFPGCHRLESGRAARHSAEPWRTSRGWPCGIAGHDLRSRWRVDQRKSAPLPNLQGVQAMKLSLEQIARPRRYDPGMTFREATGTAPAGEILPRSFRRCGAVPVRPAPVGAKSCRPIGSRRTAATSTNDAFDVAIDGPGWRYTSPSGMSPGPIPGLFGLNLRVARHP